MSIQFEVNRTFQSSQNETFHALVDVDSAKHWMQGLVGIKRLDEGPMRVGSQWIETRKMFGKEASEHFEVIELTEPNKIVLRCDGTKGTTGKGEFIFTYNLSTVNNASHVTLNGEINGLTGFSKLMGKLIMKTFAKACEKDLDALKMYMETSCIKG